MTQLKESVDEMKNSIGALNSRMATAEDRISELEDELQKAYRQQQIMAKDLKMALERIRVLGDDLKRNNIRIIGVPEKLFLYGHSKRYIEVCRAALLGTSCHRLRLQSSGQINYSYPSRV